MVDGIMVFSSLPIEIKYDSLDNWIVIADKKLVSQQGVVSNKDFKAACLVENFCRDTHSKKQTKCLIEEITGLESSTVKFIMDNSYEDWKNVSTSLLTIHSGGGVKVIVNDIYDSTIARYVTNLLRGEAVGVNKTNWEQAIALIKASYERSGKKTVPAYVAELKYAADVSQEVLWLAVHVLVSQGVIEAYEDIGE